MLKLFDDDDFLEYVRDKRDGLMLSMNSIRTLALRGSTADYSFYSSVYFSSYNLGLTSTDLYTCFHLYKNYRNELVNLKDIIVFMGIFVPGYSLIQTSERCRAVAYRYFFNIPYLQDKLIPNRFDRWISKRCTSLKDRDLIDSNGGYYKKTYYATHISAQDRVSSHLRENVREPNQLIWLVNLADLICEDNRRLILVFPPFRKDYLSLLPDASLCYKKILELNLNKTKIVDFTNSEIFLDSDFGDTEHLLEKGAIKLTKELYRILEEENNHD